MTGILAKRYILPLFEVAVKKNALDAVEADLKLITDTLKSSPELKKIIFNPAETRTTKWKIIESLFSDISPITKNFLHLLVYKNRAEILLTASKLFTTFINEHKGLKVGIVESVIPLSDTDLNTLKDILNIHFKGNIKLENKLNPSLLGGVRVQIGNTVIDNSLRNKLVRLKSELLRE